MVEYNGFITETFLSEITSDTQQPSGCMKIDFENTGDVNVNLTPSGSVSSYLLKAGDSVAFGSQNPLLRESTLFGVAFSGAGTKSLKVTKIYAKPQVLTW